LQRLKSSSGCERLWHGQEGYMIHPIRWDLYHVIRNQRRCLRCGICVQVCPYGVHAHIGDIVVSVDEECLGCGLCERQCPAGALEVRLTRAEPQPDSDEERSLAFLPVERLAI